ADIKRECRQQTNVSWTSLKQLKAGNFEQHDMKLKCYLKCFMVKNGILNENSNIDVEKALRHLPRSMQESSRKILHRCKSIQAENTCDKAFQIATCYVKEQPDVYYVCVMYHTLCLSSGAKKTDVVSKEKDLPGCCSKKEKKGGCCGAKCCSGTKEEHGGCCSDATTDQKSCCPAGKAREAAGGCCMSGCCKPIKTGKSERDSAGADCATQMKDTEGSCCAENRK
ncbi:Pheromone-binding protein-related protein 3, partial [Cyphomyrmex costatus]